MRCKELEVQLTSFSPFIHILQVIFAFCKPETDMDYILPLACASYLYNKIQIEGSASQNEINMFTM